MQKDMQGRCTEDQFSTKMNVHRDGCCSINDSPCLNSICCHMVMELIRQCCLDQHLHERTLCPGLSPASNCK